jgi:hypothetical protein
MRTTAALCIMGIASLATPALAGEVTSKLQNGTLTLVGDDGGTDLTLTNPAMLFARGAAGTTVIVTPGVGTTLDGSADPATFEPVEDVKLKLGDGTNKTLCDVLEIPGKLTVKGGGGGNHVELNVTHIDGDVKVTLGSGGNLFYFNVDSSLGDDLSVTTGDGGDDVTLDGGIAGGVKLTLGDGGNELVASGNVGDDFSYKGGSGADSLTLAGVSFIRGLGVKTGNGGGLVLVGEGAQIGEEFKFKGGKDADTVSVAAQVGEALDVNLSSGNNNFTLTDSQVGEDLVVKAKDGDDTVTFVGTNAIGGETIFKPGGGADTLPAL